MNSRTLDNFSIRSLKNTTSRAAVFESRVKDFGVLNKRRASASGEVTVSRSDSYDFTLNRKTSFRLTLFNTANADRIGIFGDTKARVQATLFDNDGRNLESTGRIKPQEIEAFSRRLAAGDYTVRITGRSTKAIQYTLRLRAA